MKMTLYPTTKWFTVAIFYSNTRELQVLSIIPVGRNVEESSFSCIRQIANLLRNTLLMDLSGDLAIISLNRHTIRILKTDICSLSIHSHRMTTCSLFIDSWFIRYLHILIHWDCDGNIWFFIKFKSDYK